MIGTRTRRWGTPLPQGTQLPTPAEYDAMAASMPPQPTLLDVWNALTSPAGGGSAEGQAAQTAVASLPDVLSQVRGWLNPQTLSALTRKVARLEAKIAQGGSPVKLAQWRAELDLAQVQLAQLQHALAPAQTEATQIQATPTVSLVWVPIAVAGLVVMGALAWALGGSRRRR